MSKAFSLNYLAKANLKNKPTRSFFLIALVMIFTLAVLTGSMVIDGLSGGIKQIGNRLGADIIVVPSGYKSNIEDVLLKGEPSTFYLPQNVMETLAEQPGIARMTPQLYIATLSASCCSYPLQIIGIEPESDFLIKPWLAKQGGNDFGDDQAIIGNNVGGEAGEELKFFNEPLQIAGRLARTGMGLDATVFVNMETAKKLAKASQKVGVQQAIDNSQISVVMIKVKPNLDPHKVAAKISQNCSSQGIFAMASKSFVNELATKLSFLANMIKGGLIILWLLALVILGLSFSAMINERQKELSTLRILGAKRRQLRQTVLLEAWHLSTVGTILGLGVGILITIVIFPLIASKLDVPMHLPNLSITLIYVVVALILGLAVGPLASIPTALKVSRNEAYTGLRQSS